MGEPAESHRVEAGVVRRWATCVVAVLSLVMGLGALPAHAGNRSPVPIAPKQGEVVDQPGFQWTPIYGANTYKVQVAQDKRFANKRFEYTTSATKFTPPSTLPAAGYWWRVRVEEPFRSAWSDKESFTRRWMVPGQKNPARPNNVTVEDFSSEPGLQAPMNALQISWSPVPDASYYVVQLDRVDDADPDLAPGDYGPYFEPPDAVCVTSHTIVTPNQSQVELPDQGVALISDGTDQGCTIDEPGTWVMRVRAVDNTVAGTQLYSLWSDEAESGSKKAPGPTVFTVGARLPEDANRTPAVLTGPSDGTRFVDAPVLSWKPKSVGPPASYCDFTTTDDPCYKVVIALDPDFTTEVGHFYTTNTRFMPLPRIPEDNAERAYYWYVSPCYALTADDTETDPEATSGGDYCISANQVVNRPGVYRHFVKLSPRLSTKAAVHKPKPYTVFKWSTSTQTVKKYARPSESVGGVDGYEFQWRFPGPGRPWSEPTLTDDPEHLPLELAFGTPYQWRVRVVDGSGQERPWSLMRDVTTTKAAPSSPLSLRAARTSNRVRLSWGQPRSSYFPITTYTVFYSLNGRRWKNLGNIAGLSAQYKVAKGTRYWFSVSANSKGGSSKPSEVVVR